MREAHADGCRPIVGERSTTAAGAVRILTFAAAPTFAVMALLTGVLDAGAPALCSAAHHTSPLSGMALMYLLMCAFHAKPWLKLMSSRRQHRGQWQSGRRAPHPVLHLPGP